MRTIARRAQRRRIRGITLIALAWMAIIAGADADGAPQADSGPGSAAGARIERPPHLPTRRDIERGLRERYRVDESDVDLVDGPHGAHGHFSLRGDLTPQAASALRGAADPQAIIDAFLATEAGTLGLSGVNDIRQRNLRTSPIGSSSVTYLRYVGDLPLDGWSLAVIVDARGRIATVSGQLTPLPPELFDAAARPTLTEGDVRAIAAEEQVKQSADPNAPMETKKLAVPEPPYVVWLVRADPWIYRIDAFSGAIVDKTWGRRSAR